MKLAVVTQEWRAIDLPILQSCGAGYVFNVNNALLWRQVFYSVETNLVDFTNLWKNHAVVIGTQQQVSIFTQWAICGLVISVLTRPGTVVAHLAECGESAAAAGLCCHACELRYKA